MKKKRTNIDIWITIVGMTMVGIIIGISIGRLI